MTYRDNAMDWLTWINDNIFTNISSTFCLVAVNVLLKGPTLHRPTCRGPRCPPPWRWRGRRCWTWRRTRAGWWWPRSALSPSCSPGCHHSRHTAGRLSRGKIHLSIEIVISVVVRSSSSFITSSANKKSSLLTSVFLSCAKIFCVQKNNLKEIECCTAAISDSHWAGGGADRIPLATPWRWAGHLCWRQTLWKPGRRLNLFKCVERTFHLKMDSTYVLRNSSSCLPLMSRYKHLKNITLVLKIKNIWSQYAHLNSSKPMVVSPALCCWNTSFLALSSASVTPHWSTNQMSALSSNQSQLTLYAIFCTNTSSTSTLALPRSGVSTAALSLDCTLPILNTRSQWWSWQLAVI